MGVNVIYAEVPGPFPVFFLFRYADAKVEPVRRGHSPIASFSHKRDVADITSIVIHSRDAYRDGRGPAACERPGCAEVHPLPEALVHENGSAVPVIQGEWIAFAFVDAAVREPS